MKKRDVLKIVAIFALFLLFIPLFQSMLFQETTAGKIHINKEIKVPFLQTSEKKLALVFFGYYGCADICTPFLEKMSKIYESDAFKPYRNDVDIYFINLNPDVKENNPDEFAKYFNSNFKGVYLTHDEIMKIDRNFGLYYANSLKNKYDMEHTDSVYLLEKNDTDFILKYVYFNKLFNADTLTQDVDMALHFVSPSGIPRKNP